MGGSRKQSGVVSGSCQTGVQPAPAGRETEERHMFTKLFVISLAVVGMAALSVLLDQGHARVVDSLVQMPSCGGNEPQCQGMSSTTKASANQFFAMLAMH